MGGTPRLDTELIKINLSISFPTIHLDKNIYPKDKSGFLQKVHFSIRPNSFMNFPFPSHCKQSKMIYIVEDSNKFSVKKLIHIK